MKLFGSITELVSAVFRKDSQLITLRPSGSVTYTQNRVVDLPPEDASSSLVSATSTQSLTNKTISLSAGSGNLLLNLPISAFATGPANAVLLRDGTGAVINGSIYDANVASSAAIALSKLAALTAGRALQSDGSGIVSASSITSTELGHLSGVSSNIQNQLNAKADTSALTAHTSASSGVHGTTSAVVGLTDSQTLQNKTIDTANNTLKIAGTTVSAVTGSGSVVLATSPSLTTPVLGVASATSINKLAITAPASGATLALADGSTLATSGAFSTTLTATGATNVTLPTSGTLARLADITTSQITGTLAASKGGTGVSNNDAATLTRTGNFDLNVTTTAPSAVTMPTSGTLATLAGTEQLTNKDIAGGTASNTSRITLPSAAKSTLDGLTRKQATLVYGTDTNKVYADDGSTLKEIGSGSSGINYLSAQYAADALGTVQTSVGDVLASSTRSNPTQWGNSAASALITQSTDSTLRGTTNYLVAYTANAQFVESPLFSIDGEDLGKPLLVQFDVSGVGTADDVQVYVARYNSSNVLQERILVAGTASATTPNSAQVPTGVTTFKGFFIPSSTAGDKYAVRWLRNANNTSMRLDTFFVGPQSLAQGAVVTAWQSYTPTVTNLTTTTPNQLGKYRRVGDTMEILANIVATGSSSGIIRISIPSGFTFDSTKLPSGSNQTVGSVKALRSGVSIYEGSVETNGTTDLQFYIADATPQAAGSTTPWTWQANDSISFYCVVPISQWSSGTTTLADRAVEEYAYNTDTTNANNTSSFANGPDGALFPNITTTGTSYTKRVRFQTPILPTDTVIVEYQQAGSGPWRNAAARFPFLFSGAATYGIQVTNVSSTDVDIVFYAQGAASTGATYGSAGELWSNYYTGGWKWRVRKVSSGAAVGFPVSARNIVGDTSGTVVPSGYVGEQRRTTFSNVTINTTVTQIAVLTNLTPGIYLVRFYADSAVGTTTRIIYSVNTSVAQDNTTTGETYWESSSSPSNAAALICSGMRYLVVSSTISNYYLVATASTAASTGGRGTFEAIRIA